MTCRHMCSFSLNGIRGQEKGARTQGDKSRPQRDRQHWDKENLLGFPRQKSIVVRVNEEATPRIHMIRFGAMPGPASDPASPAWHLTWVELDYEGAPPHQVIKPSLVNTEDPANPEWENSFFGSCRPGRDPISGWKKVGFGLPQKLETKKRPKNRKWPQIPIFYHFWAIFSHFFGFFFSYFLGGRGKACIFPIFFVCTRQAGSQSFLSIAVMDHIAAPGRSHARTALRIF